MSAGLRTHALTGLLVDPVAGRIYHPNGKSIARRFVDGHRVVTARIDGQLKLISCARVCWESVYGPIPEGMTVRSSRGVPKDFRIGYLRLVKVPA